jgi:hypothetical protein
MNYTKGPWVVDYRGSVGHIKSVPEGSKPGVTPTPTVCRYDSMAISMSEDEKKDNANLISAAPDLYEALNLVLHWWRHGDEGDMPISIEVACDKAILKAEGREV